MCRQKEAVFSAGFDVGPRALTPHTRRRTVHSMDTPPVVQTSSTTATAGGAVYEPAVIEWWQDSSTPTTIMETQQHQPQHQQQAPPQQEQPLGSADVEAHTADQQAGTHQMERAPSLELKMETVIPNREELTRAKEQSREAAQLRVSPPPLHTCIMDSLFIIYSSPSHHFEDVHKMDKLAAEGRLASHPNQRPHTRPAQYALLFHFHFPFPPQNLRLHVLTL